MEKSSWRNNRPRHWPALSLCLWLAFFPAGAQIGGLPGAYLRAPVGATAFAMGGAQGASPEVLCTWHNPAMLSQVRATRIDCGGGLLSLGRTEGYSSLEYKISPRVGMGLFALYCGDPSIDKLYDENEEPLQSGAFTAVTAKIGLSYLVTRKMSIGLTIGYYYERLPTTYDKSTLNYSSAAAMGGFDFAIRYTPLKNWTVAALLRNIDILKVLSGQSASVEMNWEAVSADQYNAAVIDRIAPEALVSSRLDLALAGRPFAWTCDAHAYMIDGDFTRLNYMELRLNNGVEWKRWDSFFLRAGLGDILLNRNIFTNESDYADEFLPRVTLGFGADLSKVQKGLRINYGIATDRAGAGVDQQVDLSYTF